MGDAGYGILDTEYADALLPPPESLTSGKISVICTSIPTIRHSLFFILYLTQATQSTRQPNQPFVFSIQPKQPINSFNQSRLPITDYRLPITDYRLPIQLTLKTGNTTRFSPCTAHYLYPLIKKLIP